MEIVLFMEKMQFTEQEIKLIYQAVRYFQIHGITFNGNDYRICDEILNKTFDIAKNPQKQNGN